ncbi:MAG: hypothetical protein ACP5SI_12140 [Chloroflexia bacterium]
MKCPNCDTPVPDGVLSCPHCGLLLAAFPGEEGAAAPFAPIARKRWWIPVVAVAGIALLAGVLVFFLWPRRPLLRVLALTSSGSTPEAIEGFPAFYPDAPIQLRLQWRLPRGRRLYVRWYHTGCLEEEIWSEEWVPGSRGQALPWGRRAVVSLDASSSSPLALGSYQVEVATEGDSEGLAQRLSFQVVPPPGAGPSEVRELGLAWLVDSDGLPIRRTNTFAPYDVVYVTARGDLGIGSRLETYWYFPGDEEPDRTHAITTTRNLRDQPLLVFLAEPVPLVPGDYRVLVCLDGQPQEELEFQVQEKVRRLGVLYEDFEVAGKWPEGHSDTVDRGYEEGKYRIEVLESEMIAWSRLHETFTDVAVLVLAEQSAGPFDSDYGVICRYVDSDNFYSFSLSGVGEYSFAKLVGDEWVTLVPWTPTSAIWGILPNRITVLCRGDELSLRVNGVLLNRLRDSDFAEGDVGIFAGTRSDASGVRVLFDDLQVVPLR